MNGPQRGILLVAGVFLLLVALAELNDGGDPWLDLAAFLCSVGCFVLAFGRKTVS